MFQEFIRNNLDILFITETWLNDSDEDRAWLQLTEFNQETYKQLTSVGKIGIGGLAMVCRKNFEVSTPAHKSMTISSTLSLQKLDQT